MLYDKTQNQKEIRLVKPKVDLLNLFQGLVGIFHLLF